MFIGVKLQMRHNLYTSLRAGLDKVKKDVTVVIPLFLSFEDQARPTS